MPRRWPLEASRTFQEERRAETPVAYHPSQVRVTTSIDVDEKLGEFCYSTEPTRLAMVLGNVRVVGQDYTARYFPDFAHL